MKNIQRKTYNQTGGVPVASMIDIVFLLIIFFVVTIDLDHEVQDQEIVLPKVKSGETIKLKKAESLTINLRKGGDITIDGVQVSEQELRKITDLVLNRWGSRHAIVVRGDGEVAFKETNKIIKLLGERNFSNVSFNAELTGKHEVVSEKN